SATVPSRSGFLIHSATPTRSMPWCSGAWSCSRFSSRDGAYCDGAGSGPSRPTVVWRSAPVIRVDCDVVMSEVAGPHGSGARPDTESNRDPNPGFFHVPRAPLPQIVGRALPFPSDEMRPEPDGELVAVSGLA